MEKEFGTDDVFALAVQIEGNGADFYRFAAERQKGKPVEALLRELAEMEEQHRRTFQGMRDQVAAGGSPSPLPDLYDEGALYVSAIADGFRVEGSPSVAEELTGEETIEDMLKLAIELEKQSVLLYVGLKDVAPRGVSAEAVDRIINEEKGHIARLIVELKRMESGS
jgi:rubrerythrin